MLRLSTHSLRPVSVSSNAPFRRVVLPVPGTYFACIMIMVAFSVVMTVVVLNYHHRNQETTEMPALVSDLSSFLDSSCITISSYSCRVCSSVELHDLCNAIAGLDSLKLLYTWFLIAHEALVNLFLRVTDFGVAWHVTLCTLLTKTKGLLQHHNTHICLFHFYLLKKDELHHT